MKLIATLALGATASTAVLGAVLPQQEPLTDHSVHHGQERYLIELAPYQTRWVTEEEKWSLKLDGVNFIDVTAERNTGFYPTLNAGSYVHYPVKMEHSEEVAPLLRNLSKDNMEKNLERFTSFHTRYYRSATGVESATWLYNRVLDVIEQTGASKHGATVEQFAHSWGQFSIIARVPGQTNRTVVLGAHQDSINLFLPSILAAPGADDDGSGTVTILEALRGLLQSETVAQGKALNTVEFHWYSAEEGGMLGSQAIFSRYKKEKRDVKAMLQQDMTGYIQGSLDAGRKEAIGIMVDYVDQGLTQFLKDVTKEYCRIGYIETKCGYACSDHTSASKYGYPSAMATESEMENSNKKIHTTDDRIKYLSFDHMLEHAKLTMDPTIPYPKELQLACLTVQRATLATKKLLEAVDKGSFDKSDSTPVTIADFAAQALIIAAIHHAFPDDVFVGEENASALRSDPALLDRTWELVASTRLTDEESDAQLYTPQTKEELLDIIDLGAQGTCSSQNRAWVLDPVDGTATFIQGQQYAVCLCLLESGRQKVGVLGCPNMNLEKGYIHEDIVDREGYGHQVFAVAGHGAYMRKMGTGALLPAHKLEPKPAITAPKDIIFVDCAGGSSDINMHARLASQLGAPWPHTTDLWATQLRYIAIAVGGCNASMKIPRKASYRSKIWDHAGGMLIVEEVGCIVSDLAGRPVDCSLGRTLAGCHGMIVAPSSIHQRFVDAVQQIM
ncbi:Zn-dependent exopeptidase [Aspergillus homomorphus CBS 101889]|uniref:Peptide hydrolase n=1 Tax=Aspergillus homomorphus (strain CBS 101889) TaxID=1450537 RepID=A0A395I1N9_ASPHC|nr:Zn-dependent exopeptidase [Aspergillus homomorphus CBS 101889]RAL13655.1 Zn-dependent exopeptidase [Aspergillus homomorphus CBS 101889]